MPPTLFVQKGCKACAKIKKEFAQEIAGGKILIVDCAADETSDADIDRCAAIVDKEAFQGFPFLEEDEVNE